MTLRHLLTHFSSSSAEARSRAGAAAHARPGQLRSREDIASFYSLDIVEPGVVYLPQWHPDEPVPATFGISELLYVGGLGHKA